MIPAGEDMEPKPFQFRARRWLKVLLVVAGALSLLALPAVFLPVSWMDRTHRAIGLGPLPEGPVVEYLARSLSYFYAFFGGLCLLAAADVERYRGLIVYLAATHLALAALLVWVALSAGLPWYWPAVEAPPAAGFGVAALALLRLAGSGSRARRDGA
jgi:hypothetical protein